jgi:hypothetical protein
LFAAVVTAFFVGRDFASLLHRMFSVVCFTNSDEVNAVPCVWIEEKTDPKAMSKISLACNHSDLATDVSDVERTKSHSRR